MDTSLKREREDGVVVAPPPSKKARIDKEADALEREAVIKASFDRLLAWLPFWLWEKARIKWESWLEGKFYHFEAWFVAAVPPSTATVNGLSDKELAAWLWFFMREHAKGHYGGDELQVLLGHLVNERCRTFRDGDDHETVLAALNEVRGLMPWITKNEGKLLTIVRKILANNEQVLYFQPDNVTTRFGSLIKNYPLPDDEEGQKKDSS